ncbi:TPA: hypothetical protein MFN52_003842 [Klebsiella quasipneumoniae subsp. similipneumoniae]|nr:hypothetical protein [Klebsiella quasipneumoniae subsp. similipneumoniae]
MIAINTDWLVNVAQIVNYHQGGTKLSFLICCFLRFFIGKWLTGRGIVHQGGIKG